MQAIPYLSAHYNIYRREIASCAYAPLPFWLSQCVTNVPIMLVNHYVFFTIMYFAAGFPLRADYYFYFSFVTFLAVLNSYYTALYLVGY